MKSVTPTFDELYNELEPYILDKIGVTLDKMDVFGDDREDMTGIVLLNLVEKADLILNGSDGNFDGWDENLEKNENLLKIRAYVASIVVRAVAYEIRKIAARRDIAEVESDSQAANFLATHYESHVDPEEYFETSEDKVLYRMFLNGASTKEIAEELCTTQKAIKARMEMIAMEIQADRSKEARRSTRPVAKT